MYFALQILTLERLPYLHTSQRVLDNGDSQCDTKPELHRKKKSGTALSSGGPQASPSGISLDDGAQSLEYNHPVIKSSASDHCQNAGEKGSRRAAAVYFRSVEHVGLLLDESD